MEPKEKTNIKLYIHDFDDDFFVLSPWDPLETPYYDTGGYRYFLPKAKAFFKFHYQFQEVVSFVEKVDEVKKEVYLSQAHWLYMKNLIKSELGLDVKIIKRYPGRLTVAELVNPPQRINKALLKQLSEAVSEKIYIKFPKGLK
ncbi:MAG: hypothetical protein ACYCTD_04690 [bacterium]